MDSQRQPTDEASSRKGHPVRVDFSEEALEIFLLLSKSSLISKKERMIVKAIEAKVQIIKEKPGFGNKVQKKLIPKEYVKKYGTKNLFRISLPCFWRMLYTLTEDKVTIIALVLDILDHKSYDKKFGYKKR